MNGLVFDADRCEMVPLIVSVIPSRQRDYIRVADVPLPPPKHAGKRIMEAVAEHYGLTVPELCGPSRAHRISHPRQLGMYLCRKLTKLSFAQIASAFGQSDHTTAINACRVVESRLSLCPATLEAYRVLREGLA